MDPIWKNLPEDLVNKICNLLPKVRQIDERLKDDIVHQWYMYDRYKYQYMSMFGHNHMYAMYDDMKEVFGLVDDFPEDMDYESVLQNMWKRLTYDDRKYISQ